MKLLTIFCLLLSVSAFAAESKYEREFSIGNYEIIQTEEEACEELLENVKTHANFMKTKLPNVISTENSECKSVFLDGMNRVTMKLIITYEESLTVN